jgi:hypothetical protein
MLEPKFAWTSAYTEEDLMTLVRASAWAHSFSRLVSLELVSGCQPYATTRDEKRQWEDNVKALEVTLQPMSAITETDGQFSPSHLPEPSLAPYCSPGLRTLSLAPSWRDSTGHQTAVLDRRRAYHIEQLVEESENTSGTYYTLEGDDIPVSIEGMMHLMVKNPKGYLDWVKKAKTR